MGVRFRSVLITTYTAQEYTIEVLDSSYASTVTDIRLAGEGFELKYEQEGDEIYAPIKSSQCKINFMVTDDSAGLTLQNWLINSVNVGQEINYNIAIYKGSDLFWYGVFLPDLSSRQDQSRPYEWEVSCTDGIGRLKDFTFNYQFADPLVQGTIANFTSIIYECLKLTPVYLTTNNVLFSTVVDWYEDRMAAKAADVDPLRRTYVNTRAFTKLGKDGLIESMTVYEVLSQICKAWCMRLIMQNGVYKFIQIGCYENTVIYHERFYNRANGGYILAITFRPNIDLNVSAGTLPRVKSGNKWSNFPPVKSVSMEFPLINSNMLETGIGHPHFEFLPNYIIGGTGLRLKFNTIVNVKFRVINFPVNTVKVTIKAKIIIVLGAGAYTFKRDPLTGDNSWEATTQEGLFEWDFPMGGGLGKPPIGVSMAFITAEIPVGSYNDNSLLIEVYSVTSTTVGGAVTGHTVSASRQANSTSLTYLANTAEPITFLTYAVNSPTLALNSFDIKEETIFGEIFNAAYFGALYTGSNTTYDVSTALWRLGDTGTARNFNLLRIFEILAQQIRSVLKYQGAVVGCSSVDGVTCILYNGQKYVLNGGTYSANSETWDGEWFMVDYVRTGIDEIDTGDNNSGGQGQEGLVFNIGEIGGVLNQEIKQGTAKLKVLTAPDETSSQILIVTANVDLPAVNKIFINERTFQVVVYNNFNSDIIAKDVVNNISFTIESGKGYTFYSNGTNYFKI